MCLSRLNEDSVVYSFGVGEDISFGLGLIERFHLTVHAFDPTPRSISWARSQQVPSQLLVHEYGIAGFDGHLKLYPPADPAHVSHSYVQAPGQNGEAIEVEVKRLTTILTDLDSDELHVLKLDIEGAEYEVIDDICANDTRPDQILIEFHHRFPGIGVEKTRKAIQQLRDLGYKLIAVSDNGEQYSFLKDSLA